MCRLMHKNLFFFPKELSSFMALEITEHLIKLFCNSNSLIVLLIKLQDFRFSYAKVTSFSL